MVPQLPAQEFCRDEYDREKRLYELGKEIRV